MLIGRSLSTIAGSLEKASLKDGYRDFSEKRKNAHAKTVSDNFQVT